MRGVTDAAARKVRLAAVHYAPVDGQTNADKCRLFGPLVEQAAKQQAELVVLPETLTWYNAGKPAEECAEPVPGPSTQYFGELARQHNLYIVAGLLERDQHKVYNVAVLLGPDGKLAGKYRKVALPRTEIDGGITPGTEYPVFETRFGKLGMMVCYDGFFPEVARGLSRNGAEVIAFPVWGCNPLLAAARASARSPGSKRSMSTPSGITATFHGTVTAIPRYPSGRSAFTASARSASFGRGRPARSEQVQARRSIRSMPRADGWSRSSNEALKFRTTAGGSGQLRRQHHQAAAAHRGIEKSGRDGTGAQEQQGQPGQRDQRLRQQVVVLDDGDPGVGGGVRGRAEPQAARDLVGLRQSSKQPVVSGRYCTACCKYWHIT